MPEVIRKTLLNKRMCVCPDLLVRDGQKMKLFMSLLTAIIFVQAAPTPALSDLGSAVPIPPLTARVHL